MWLQKLLVLLLCAVCFILCTESPMWEYRFVNKNLTWSEAQQFCRQHYHDLACVSSSEDNLRLPRPPGYSAPVWIGLYDDPTDLSQWKWTGSNSSVSFVDWKTTFPKYHHVAQQCAATSSGGWVTGPCYRGSRRPAVCFSGSNPKVYHNISDRLSWDDAVARCRNNYTDLAMIETTQENTDAKAYLDPRWDPWIGLHRSTGRWSDNRPVTFFPFCLEGYSHLPPICMAETVHKSWKVHPCQDKLPFYCQVEEENHRFVKMAFSGHNLGVISHEMLEKMQKRFEAEGRTDVKLKWKTAPKKQEKKEDKPEDCPYL